MRKALRLWSVRAWKQRHLALHVGSIVGGWYLLTRGLAELLVPEVWFISGGLFLLSVAGWGHLRVLFSAGVYALKRAGDA